MLEGRLDDLSLPDLFQLLALTDKTGTLRVRYGDTAGAVIFRDGQIVGAFDDVRRTAPGTRMLAAGLIDDAQLEAALEASERHGEGGAIGTLVAQGAVDEDTVAEFRRQQAEDAVFTLMRLTDATFSLETGEVSPLAGEVELDTEQLIVEGGRRLSEWAEIRGRVPGRQSVPSLVTDPPGEGPVTVGREQWRLLALVDGRRTVGDLVDLLGGGEYATSAELSALVDAGLVSVGDRATHADGVRSRGERLRELEVRELGLLRDDPAETPESASATTGAEADEGVDVDEADAEAEASEAHSRARPAARPSRSTLSPTLTSGIELGEDALTAGEPAQRDNGQATAAEGPLATGEGSDDVVDDGHVEAEHEPAEHEVVDDGPAEHEGGRGEPRAPAVPDPLPAAPPQGAASEPMAAASAPADDPSQALRQSLGAELPAAPDKPAAAPSGGATGRVDGPEPAEERADDSRLTRDEDISKAMLLRLIDGVRGV